MSTNRVRPTPHAIDLGAVSTKKFWPRVRKGKGRDACWLFTGGSKNGVHGTMPDGEYAHRFSWRLHFGAIPDGLQVLHTCDVGRCVKPAHLFLGTQLDNIEDMNAKGRGVPPPVHAGETHPKATLSDEEAMKLRAEFVANGGRDQRGLAKKYGCSNSTAWRIGKGVTR